MNKKTVKDIEVKGKRVLVRCDFNVPMKEGVITDDLRITAALPTIKYLSEQGAKVVLCSHLGRPKGEFNLKYTLAPVAKRLSEYLGKVEFCEDCVGEKAENAVARLNDGEILLLENLRFYKEEEANDREFARKLASLCDVYVNDAFGTAHRAHASTAGVVQHGFVKTAVAGFLMHKEISFMSSALETPERPFVAVMGGAKVSDKIGVISNLLTKVDALIIGGGMAYTFLKAKGAAIGDSLLEADKLETASKIMEEAAARGVKLYLPTDVKATEKFPEPVDAPAEYRVMRSNIEDGFMGLDIGPETQKKYAEVISSAKTVVWNGPMGVFENPVFAEGTRAVAKAIAESEALSIVGGGDSAAAVNTLGYSEKITHISTGGGASLEFLEGKSLPGVACLNDK